MGNRKRVTLLKREKGEKREKQNEDDIGYKKPPKRTQFQPGQSGNPKGRPKGTKNLKMDVDEELGESIHITEGGKIKIVSKQRAILKRTTTKALNGDARATDQIFKLSTTQSKEPEDSQETETLIDEDKAILQRFIEQQKRTTSSTESLNPKRKRNKK